MSLLIFYLFLALAVSFLCSILEAVLLSSSESYMAMLERTSSRTGQLLKKYKTDIDRPLSAILSLNTIAHTVGAAGVGAQAQIVFGDAYVSIISAILTLLILILSEIIPKTLGATYWKELIPVAVQTLRVLMILMYPLVIMSQWITRLLARDKKVPSFSREEFSALADRGVEEGVFEEEESKIFKNLIRFNSLRVRDIMTPRIVVVYFSEERTVDEISRELEEMRFSRLPLFGENEDNITGYVLKNDLLVHIARGEGQKKLKELKRQIPVIPETASLKILFERLLEQQDHIAAVVDEYGGFSGVVTMEDLVETLLGMEIIDEVDAYEDMQKLAREKWEERARRLGIVKGEEQKEAGDHRSI